MTKLKLRLSQTQLSSESGKFVEKNRNKMSFLYNSVFRRTSTFAVGVLASVFFFERAFDWGADALFEKVNKGVSLAVIT